MASFVLPTPTRDEKLFREILDTGFACFPERRENYRKFEMGKRGVHVDYLPIQIDIENVSRCNFRCTMCAVSEWPKGRRAADMTLEDFKALIDSQIGLTEVKIQGMGEPLLGDEFFEMVRYCRSRHLWVRSTTNASMLHARENYKSLIDSDISEIQVSIDGVSKHVYQAIRQKSNYDRMVNNCRLLNEYAAKAGRRRTRMWSLLQKANFGEIQEFPRFAASLGFERLTLSGDLNSWGDADWKDKNEKVCQRNQMTEEMARELLDAGKKHGVEVTFWFPHGKFDFRDSAKVCNMLFQRVWVSSDLRILPCSAYADPANIDLGDARNLTEEWNGKRMTKFRKIHLEGHIPKFCRACYRNDE